jgi:hypothetical protein
VAGRTSIALLTALSIALCCLLATADQSNATEIWNKPTRGAFGVKLGLITGTETRGDMMLRTSWDKTFEIFAAVPVFRNVFAQFAFDFHSLTNNRTDNWMLDINLGLKPRLRFPKANMVVHPGLAVGYGHVGTHDSFFEDTDYITVRAFVETGFRINQKTDWLAELSVLFTPQGGSNGFDLRIGPVFLLRVGLALK